MRSFARAFLPDKPSLAWLLGRLAASLLPPCRPANVVLVRLLVHQQSGAKTSRAICPWAWPWLPVTYRSQLVARIAAFGMLLGAAASLLAHGAALGVAMGARLRILRWLATLRGPCAVLVSLLASVVLPIVLCRVAQCPAITTNAFFNVCET